MNCGSSSLKCAVLEDKAQKAVLSGLAECLGTAEARLKIAEKGSAPEETSMLSLPDAGHDGALMALLDVLKTHNLFERIEAVGHRIVHGGEKFRTSALITPGVLSEIEACTPLAPLHNPANLSGIRAAMKFFPGIPHVAVFDTAFHQTMSDTAFIRRPTEILPKIWRASVRVSWHQPSFRRGTNSGTVGAESERPWPYCGSPRQWSISNNYSQRAKVDTTMGMTLS